MKNVLCCLFVLFSSVAFTADLEIISSSIVCSKNDIRPFEYSYNVGAILKNTSNAELKVITSFATQQSSGVSFLSNGSGGEFQFGGGHAIFDGSPIIPSESSLSLVVLKPGEITQVSGVKNSTKPFKADEAVVTYQPTSEFKERFGYWVGIVKGSQPSYTYLEQCQS